ncbi:MAG: Stp1/IreP family PP2C-type Ser/Thr phosphatase [Bacteroidales bacterium]|nr:Stp1/IreP family PP2C-type Ser/Thr phosphatase [Bacteroidales bacterium]
MNLEYKEIGKTDKGLVRPKNEDNMGSIDSPNGKVFTVCDGMGGHVAGQVASTIAVESILGYMAQDKHPNIKQAMANAIQYANSQIFARSDAEPQLKGMGTTVTMLVVQEDKVYIAHVGDSRIYLHSNNILYRITKDHSLVQQLVDNNIITDVQAETDSRKNQITKALGIDRIVEPTVSENPIQPKVGDTFLLCSDGLSDMVDEINISLVIGDDDLNLEQKANQLVDMAKGAGGKDNITLQLVQITKSPFPVSSFVNFSSQERIEGQKAAFITEEKIDQKNEKKDLGDTQNLPQFDKQKELDKKPINQKSLNSDGVDTIRIENNFFTKKRILMFGGILLVLIIIAGIFIIQKNGQTRYLIVQLNNQNIDTLNLDHKADFQSQFAEYCKDKSEGTYNGIVTNNKYKPISDIVLAPQNIIPESEIKFKGTFSIEGTNMPEQNFKTQQEAQNYIDIVIKNKKYYNIVVKNLAGEIIIEKNLAKNQGNDNPPDDQNVVDDPVIDDPVIDDPVDDGNNTDPATIELTSDENFGNNLKKQTDKNGQIYITDQNNNIILGPYKEIEDIGNNIFSVKNTDDLWGYINSSATVIFEPEFTEKVNFTDGIAIVKTDLGKKFIKSNGTELSEELFEDARPFVEGFAAVKQNSKWGFIKQTDGAFLAEPEYDKVEDFAGGMAAVNKTIDGWGFINKNGKIVYNCRFTEISSNFSATKDVAIVVETKNGSKVLYNIDKNGTCTRVPN